MPGSLNILGEFPGWKLTSEIWSSSNFLSTGFNSGFKSGDPGGKQNNFLLRFLDSPSEEFLDFDLFLFFDPIIEPIIWSKLIILSERLDFKNFRFRREMWVFDQSQRVRVFPLRPLATYLVTLNFADRDNEKIVSDKNYLRYLREKYSK